MITISKREELKTKVYLEKDGTKYALVVSNQDRIDGIYELTCYHGKSYWNLLNTKSIRKVFGVQKATLLAKLGFSKGESIVIDSAYGEV